MTDRDRLTDRAGKLGQLARRVPQPVVAEPREEGCRSVIPSLASQSVVSPFAKRRRQDRRSPRASCVISRRANENVRAWSDDDLEVPSLLFVLGPGGDGVRSCLPNEVRTRGRPLLGHAGEAGGSEQHSTTESRTIAVL
jgi:hypothetical protein